jgi:predicted MPP superfamily phosphohydrolase
MQYPVISHYSVACKELPKAFDGFKIVQLSDLHNKVFDKNNAYITELIDKISPDIVVMTGDMFSHKITGLSDYIGMVRDISRRTHVFYVNGNHELSDADKRTFEMTEAELARIGAVNLDNRRRTIARNGKQIDICGLCYTAEYYKGVREYRRGYKDVTAEVITEHIGEPTDRFTILLAHNPLDFDEQAKWGANLSFGGHVHGGSIRLPVVGGILSPEWRLFPKYQSGLYRKKTPDGKEHFLVVSRGLGRLRINNKPDVVCCTCKSLM